MKCYYCGGESHTIGECPLCQDHETTLRLLREHLESNRALRAEVEQDNKELSAAWRKVEELTARAEAADRDNEALSSRLLATEIKLADVGAELAKIKSYRAEDKCAFDALQRDRNEWQAKCQQLERDLLEEIESAARRECFTDKETKTFNGVPETNITDSSAMSSQADLLRRLAAAGRFRIVREFGRMVVGYWPENDPQKGAKP